MWKQQSWQNVYSISELGQLCTCIYRKIPRIAIFFWGGGGLRMFSIFYSHIEKKYRPGHGPSLQVTVSVLVPEQNFPPCKGAGFEQVLWRVFMPPPHVFEHELKGAHALQLPSTKKNNLWIFKYFNIWILINNCF